MPAVDTVLLPLCVGLSLLGVIATGLAWRRGNKGRVIQGIGLALAPIALYVSGLLRLLWNGVAAVASWASKVILSPAVWLGLSLLALCVVLWVVGGLLARRFPGRAKTKSVDPGSGKAVTATRASSSKPAAPAQRPGRGSAKQSPAPVDEDMAEIEALLKSRGIE